MKHINTKTTLIVFLNSVLAGVLVYGIVTAIHVKETLWVIAYVATFITQILQIIYSYERNNKAGGNRNDET